MNFTIFNYTSPTFFQPIYLKHEIDKLMNCKADVINDTSRIYYTYDIIKPEYSIINAGMNFGDCIHYNRNSNHKIKHILNIDYLKSEYIDSLKTFLKDELDFNCVLLFSTNANHKKEKFNTPYLHLPNCADINIPESSKVFTIDKGIIINSESEKREYDGSHHFISIGNPDIKCDITANNISASRIYKNYKQLIFRNINPSIIPEAFYNALYFGNRVYIENDDKNDGDKVQEILSKALDTKVSFHFKDNEQYDVESVRNKIKTKHSPKNRLKQLLSQLKGTHNLLLQMEK